MSANLTKDPNDASGFVVLADYIPQIVQEIRYHSSYNFVGERIDGSLRSQRDGDFRQE